MTTLLYQLNSVSVVDISGIDAAAIVHNITTNEVKSLEIGEGRETFITDVRGKTIGHGFLYRQHDHLRFVGPADQSQRFAEHLDRYTIREDATATVRDQEYACIVMGPEGARLFAEDIPQNDEIRSFPGRIGEVNFTLYRTRWLGEGSCVALVAPDQIQRVRQQLSDREIALQDESQFHQDRTAAGFPWYGIDLNDTNLPQEADRDSFAVSFTKGCYLGQETVARLDALGQVQKKLVRWSISGAVPSAGATLLADEKTVGRLTSVATLDDGAIALGFARRSHFDPGSTAVGIDEATGKEFTGVVVQS